MAEIDPRLGYTNEHGEVYPLITVSGQPYSERGGGVHGVGDGFFVVLDPFPVAGFDLAAAIAELMPDAPPKADAVDSKKAKATNAE